MEQNNRKGYKAFKAGLVCEPDSQHRKQYAENTDYEEAGGDICGAGMMHYCLNPFDCLDYYPLVDVDGNMTEFCEVEALDEPVTDDNKKYAAKKLHVGAKLGLKGFVNAAVDFIYKKTIKDMPNSSGNSVQIGSSGDDARIGSSGYGAQIGSSGDGARIGSSGYDAQIDISGEDSVAATVGINGRIKGALGNWITLAEWKWGDSKGRNVPLCVRSAQIDGVTLKADTWYRLENGEFVEANDGRQA